LVNIFVPAGFSDVYIKLTNFGVNFWINLWWTWKFSTTGKRSRTPMLKTPRP